LDKYIINWFKIAKIVNNQNIPKNRTLYKKELFYYPEKKEFGIDIVAQENRNYNRYSLEHKVLYDTYKQS